MSALAKYSFYDHNGKMSSFKARKSSRKSSRKVSKRKSSRKSSRKVSRKSSRKSSRKVSRKSSRKVSRKSSTKKRANRRTIEADDCINRSGNEASCGYEPNCEWVAPTQRCRLRKLSRSVTGKVSYEGPMGPPPAAVELAFKSKKSRKSGKKSRRSRKSGKKSRKMRKSGKKSRKMRK